MLISLQLRTQMKILLILLPLALLLPHQVLSNSDKVLSAKRISTSITIDGQLDEEVWTRAATARNFIQKEPYNGEKATYDTEVKVLFDDAAIYIGAVIYDPFPDSISMELGQRDNIGLADYFGVEIDPFNDGLNAYGFYVTSRGVQADMRINNTGSQDFSWDAVWHSGLCYFDEGWSVEIMIPYSALRFSSNGDSRWGINFSRSIQRRREHTSWTWVDPRQGGVLNQAGELSGLKNIQPPVRISATPYFSTYASHNTENQAWRFAYNYGLDLKLGLNESFTLDLTLIPDFGQVESDDLVYSLSPFEVYYSEKRPFFTEGTEMFSKGGVFYSRRIGARPSKYYDIRNTYAVEDILSNPEHAQLINAAKLSGKTAGGLGIGVFNAITANTYAVVKDSTGKEKEVLTEPFTNFNMLILDQALANNSFLSVYNTNVYKPDLGEAANVSGTQFRIRNKPNSLEFTGLFNVSQHYSPDHQPITGERLFARIGKISGNFLADTWFNMLSDTYDPNDFGFQHRNDQLAHGINLRYNIYEPHGPFNRSFSRLYFNHYYHYSNRMFTILETGGDFRVTTRDHLSIGGNFNYNPFGFRDFYESRTANREYYRPPSYNLGFWWSPDYRKPFVIDYRVGIRHSAQYEEFNWNASVTPRWRPANNVLLRPGIAFSYQLNNMGYVHDSLHPSGDRAIIFGRRDVKNITTSLNANLAFTPATSLGLRMRHYWLRVNYLEYYDLLDKGKLASNDYTQNEDFSVNAFNVDMVFKWDFAPGSELLLVWKNAVFNDMNGGHTEDNYFKNLQNTFESPIHNSFSIKLLYYLDWHYLKNIRSGRDGTVSESFT